MDSFGTPGYQSRYGVVNAMSELQNRDGHEEVETSLKTLAVDLMTDMRSNVPHVYPGSTGMGDKNPFSPFHSSNKPSNKDGYTFSRSGQIPSDPFRLYSSPVPTHSSPIYSQTRSIPTIPGMIGTIPTFSADIDSGENIEQFFSLMDRSARCGSWDDDIKISILISKLRGKALKTFNEGIGLIPDLRYDDIRAHLFNLYRSKESRAEKTDRFMRMTQRSDENVEAFYFRLKGLASGLTYSSTVVEEVLFERFVDGIRPDVAKHVMMERPTDIIDALEIAKKFEDIDIRIGRKSRKVAVVTHDDPRDKTILIMKEEIGQLKDLMTEMGENIKQLGIRDKHTPKVIMCELCKGNGHTANRCLNYNQENLN